MLVVHWIADFVIQTHWQATNKSKDNIALLAHVTTYTLCIGFVTPFLGGVWILWIIFVFVNGIAHFITDYFTSRWTSRLYARQDWHNFFVVVGLDQLIHQMTLAGTLWFILAS
jgi:hypothetical protein